MAAATFILVHKKADDAAKAKAALSFFDWAYRNGDAIATELDYVPLPAELVQQVEAYWAEQLK